jgi:hypothetical protein
MTTAASAGSRFSFQAGVWVDAGDTLALDEQQLRRTGFL